jgi:DNA-binding NarL/FixJ family response regulator
MISGQILVDSITVKKKAMIPQIRILIFSRHVMFREGLKRMLEEERDFSVMAMTDDEEQAVNLVVDLEPDILLIDGSCLKSRSAGSGLNVLNRLASKKLTVRSILLNTSDDGQIIETLKYGVRGEIRKEAAASLLFKCIRSVMEGGYWIGHDTTCELIKSLEFLNTKLENWSKFMDCRLSGRELQVVKEIASGGSNKDIAQKLLISEQAVKYHLTNIFNKTGLSSRMELARFVIRHQLIREA